MKSNNINSKRNTLVVAITVICVIALAVALAFCLWSKFKKPDAVDDNAVDTRPEYMITVSDSITAYEGDEHLLMPHMVNKFGNVEQGRFSYAVVNAANAPVSVSENGVVTVKPNTEAESAVIEITELNTQIKTTVNVSVCRKLSGIKGVVFGEDLVVTTQKQYLQLGDEYTVTVKTIPSSAVLTDNQIAVKTVDKYGKEVGSMFSYSVVPGTSKIKIKPTGLGDGIMVFSVIADGKELCKDERYEFGVSLASDWLDEAVKEKAKREMSDDPVEREKIELIPATELRKLDTLTVPVGTTTLHGVTKENFPALETVVFESDTIVRLTDEKIESNVCYRVKSGLYASYAADEFWSEYLYDLIPYEKDVSEKWVVYHYLKDGENGSRDADYYCEKLTDGYSLKRFESTGYRNDYYYIGKDPKPTDDADKTSVSAAVLDEVNDVLRDGLHVGVGYSPNEYKVEYVITDVEHGDRKVTVRDTRTWVYGESLMLYSLSDFNKECGENISRTGYVIDGWLTDASKLDSKLELDEYQVNLTSSDKITLYGNWQAIYYTVIYKNGTDDEQDNKEVRVAYDEKITIKDPAVKKGYRLTYYESGERHFDVGLEYSGLLSEPGVITLTAQYRAITYNVVFNRNGGNWVESNGVDKITLEYDKPYTLCTLSQNGKTGYEWVGIDSAGQQIEGRVYPSTGEIINLTAVEGSTVTLKAFWDPLKYNVVYKFQNFSYRYIDNKSQNKIANNEFTQSRIFGDGSATISPTRSGYTAKNWTVMYYTDKGSATQKPVSDDTIRTLGDKNEFITGKPNAKEDGRTYYLQLNSTPNTYTVTYDYGGATSGNTVTQKTVTFDAVYDDLPTPVKYGANGSAFNGWYLENSSTRILSSTVVKTARNHRLVAKWSLQSLSHSISNNNGDLSAIALNSSESVKVTISGGSRQYDYSTVGDSGNGWSWSFNKSTGILTVSVTAYDLKGTISFTVTDRVYGTTTKISKSWSSAASPPPPNHCLARGTLITLADGSRVPVEELKGDELLLVWNFFTGTYDVAPILFIDYDAPSEVDEITLIFSNGAKLVFIDGHGIWDMTLDKFVYIDGGNAQSFVGHSFVSERVDGDGNFVFDTVTLTGVSVEKKLVEAWSPVTPVHFNCFADGMLIIPMDDVIDGLLNIFEVDPDTMKYDEEKMAADLQKYGEFTYEDFAEYIPEEVYIAFNGRYLKVAIGKGNLTWDDIYALIERYGEFWS